jgi:acyl carrier protein
MNEKSQASTMAADTETEPWSPALSDEDVPNTETERIIARVWVEVLNLDRIGRHEDFFDLGGHSVLATQVAARLRTALDRDVPERALFDWPTVATLASAVPGYPAMDEDTDVPLSRRRAGDAR